MSSTGMRVGLEKGYPVEKLEKKARPARAKGRLSKRTAFVRALVTEVVGQAPYERRMMDMIRTGGTGAEKRLYKFAKRRLGSHKRAIKKREQIKELIGQQRAKAAMA